MHVYCHIPFCASRCVYCDFYLELAKYGGQQAFVDALCQEIDLRWHGQPLEPIKTLYFGGGTPSLLTADHYEQIFEHFRRYTSFAPGAELTLEANPCDLTSPPEAYRAVGFNRISLGVQSLNDLELKKLSRRHSAQQAIDVVHQVSKAGFDNISIDLMYGLPCQTQDSWQASLDAVCQLPIQHVSFYGLQIEAGTPMERLVETPSYQLPPNEQWIPFYWQGVETLEAAGLKLYEFSNMARPDCESQHNTAYWRNKDYWAFGPSAHGYQHPLRYENAPDLKAYLSNPLGGEQHTITELERFENQLIFGLRLTQGVEIEVLENSRFWSLIREEIKEGLEKGKLKLENKSLCLARQWIPRSNEVLASFITLN